MKKAIALVLLLLAFTLAACAEKEGPATSATEPTAESTTAKSTEAVIPPLTVGMTYDEVSRLPIPHVDAFHLVFCRDGAGNSVVGEYDADSRTISSVRTFPAVTADSAAFASIALGMDIFDVVERVGVPFGMIIAEVELVDPSIGDPPNDPAFLLFACTDGTEYQIELGSNRRVAWIKQTPNPLGITLEPDKADLPSYAVLCTLAPDMTRSEVFTLVGNPQRTVSIRIAMRLGRSLAEEHLCYVYDSSDGRSVAVLWGWNGAVNGEPVILNLVPLSE